VGNSSTQWISFTGGGNRRWDPVLKTRIWGSSCLRACLHGSWLHQRSTWLGSCQLLQLISKLVRKLWIVMDYEGEPVDHPPPAQQSCCTQSLWDHWSRKAWISSMQNIHEMVCSTMRKYNLHPLNISQWENWSKTLKYNRSHNSLGEEFCLWYYYISFSRDDQLPWSSSSLSLSLSHHWSAADARRFQILEKLWYLVQQHFNDEYAFIHSSRPAAAEI